VKRALKPFVHDRGIAEIGAQVTAGAIDRAEDARSVPIDDNVALADPGASHSLTADRSCRPDDIPPLADDIRIREPPQRRRRR
jgi:hypothetical protein